jgi:uncharacterized iron-regulated membrane protein
MGLAMNYLVAHSMWLAIVLVVCGLLARWLRRQLPHHRTVSTAADLAGH